VAHPCGHPPYCHPVSGGPQAREGGPDVRQVALDVLVPRTALRGPQVWRRLLDQLEEVAGVGSVGGLGLLAVEEAAVGELTNDAQHRDARLGRVVHRAEADQADVGEALEPGKGVQPSVGTGHHRLHRRERRRPPEHREPSEEPASRPVEELLAPLDRRPHGAVTLREIARPAGEEVEEIGHPAGQGTRVQIPHTGRRQFDGEWEPVELGDDLADRLEPGRVEHEMGVGGPGPLDEQLDCRVHGLVTGGAAKGLRVVEHRHRHLVLGPQAERGTARDESGEPGGPVEQVCHERSGIDHLLEVVEGEEELLVGQVLAHGVGDRLATAVEEPERLGDGPADRIGLGHRGERHPSGAVGEPVGHPLDHRQGDPGLADPAGPGQGHQPHGGPEECVCHLVDLVLPTDQRRGGGGQSGQARPALPGAGRGWRGARGWRAGAAAQASTGPAA
jgi:hypothetical protein